MYFYTFEGGSSAWVITQCWN